MASSTTINELSLRCLRNIFTFLPISDRVRLERVCRYWQHASTSSWVLEDTLDLSSSLWGFTHCEIPAAIFHGLLKHKCGKFLTRINLSCSQDNTLIEDSETIYIIIEFCPNLVDIDFSSFSISHLHLQNIAQNYRNLTKLKIGEILMPFPIVPSYCDKEFRNIFQNNLKLKYFEIQHYIIDKCLLFLPALRMHTLKLQTCYFDVPMAIVETLQKLRNLTHLTLYKCKGVPRDILEVISTHCRKLTELEFVCDVCSTHLVHKLIHLVNLKVLTIHNNVCVSDTFLDNLVRRCVRLTCIDISGCDFVTDKGLAAIARLVKLRKLILNNLNRITGNFSNMHRLNELHCQKCTLINDESISMLINSSLRIKLLDISGCSKVTDAGLTAITGLLKLKKLILNDMNQITGRNLPNMRHLKELHCQKCELINDESMPKLIESTHKLQLLDISGCSNVTDTGLAVIARLEKLEILVLNNLNQITGRGLQNIHHLKELHCQRCKLINDESISTFIKSSYQLQLLDISNCKNITNITLQAAIDVYKDHSNNMTIIVKGTQIEIRKEIIPKSLGLSFYEPSLSEDDSSNNSTDVFLSENDD